MNKRLLEAISKLKKSQDNTHEYLIKTQKVIDSKINELEKDINEKGNLNMQKILLAVSEDLSKYTIVNGNWYYNGKDTGIKAEGIDGKDGKDFKFEDFTEQQLKELMGAPGKDGYTPVKGKDYFDGKDGYTPVKGKDYFDGKDGYTPVKGKDYFDGKDGYTPVKGKDYFDGKDGVVPEIKIGKVETSPEYGGALAKFRKGKDNILYLDLTLPRGPQGFTGFDGKDAKINGSNTIKIEAGRHITLDQEDDTLIINATGGGEGHATDVQINGSSIVSNNTANIATNSAYNASSNKIATMSDIPSVADRLKIYSRSGYDVDTCYDAGIYLVASGTNVPSGSNYGDLLVMPYRKISGNTKPDYGAQIFIPNGDDNTQPNSFYYRTSLADTWNDWQILETTTNKVTSISSRSTNTQYPSALAVYNYIQSLDASEVSY